MSAGRFRKNLRYDGELIDLAWKARKIDRSKVFAICDVSGSVATYARFMLMFLYGLEAVLPGFEPLPSPILER